MTRLLFALLLASAPAFAQADVNPVHPVSYATPSPDGKWLFVMLPPPSADPKLDPDNTAHLKGLRATYPKSGLYPNDGTAAAAWTVDWYAYAVFPANDGEHLVRIEGESTMLASFVGGKRLAEEIAFEQIEGPALTFTNRGRPLKTYTVRQLVGEPERLPHSIKHVLWLAGGTITEDGKRFVMQTQDSRQLIFDLATGDVVSNKQAGLGNIQVWTVRAMFAVVLGVLVAYGVRHLIWGRKDAAARPNAV